MDGGPTQCDRAYVNDMALHRRWAVVGGGMMGMVTALRLAEARRDVTLVEAAPDLGGLAAPCTLGDIAWDRFYHVILSSDRHLLGLLASLGLEDAVRFGHTGTGLHIGGRLRDVSTPLRLLMCRQIPLAAKFGLARAVLASMADVSVDALDGETAVDWLTRHSGKSAVNHIWRPLLRSKLGDRSDQASALFIWATLRRLYGDGAGRAGSGKFGYVDGGYRRIIGVLEARLLALGVTIMRDWPVMSLRREGDQHIMESTAGRTIIADRVVLTLPGPQIARLGQQMTEAEKQSHSAAPYLGVICLSLLLDRPITDYYVSNLIDDRAPFTGIIEMSNLVDPETFGGRRLVYLPLYLPADDPRFAESDDQIADRFQSYLRRLAPAFAAANILAQRVNRAPNVLAFPAVGRAASVGKVRTTVPGVFVVNSAQILDGSLDVNETIRHAESNIAQLLRASPIDDRVTPNIAYWANVSPWDDRLAELEVGYLFDLLAKADLLPGPKSQVLDIGCGPGITARRLKGKVRRYVGLDVSVTALALARRRVGDASGFVFLPTDPNAPENVDAAGTEPFDLIICNSVIQYLPGLTSVRLLFQALGALMAPGASAVIGDVPVRPGMVREGVLLFGQAARAGFPLQAAWSLAGRAKGRYGRRQRATPAIYDVAGLVEAAEAAGLDAAIRPMPARPAGTRIALFCSKSRAAGGARAVAEMVKSG